VQRFLTIPLALLSGYGYIAVIDLHNGRLESKSWKKLLTVVSVGPLQIFGGQYETNYLMGVSPRNGPGAF